ncbi:MAG: MFS transporter [Acinetobacter sp.]
MNQVSDIIKQQSDATPQQRPTKRRWFILLLLLFATTINYIDRVNISIAAPFLSKDLGLDKVEMGLIFSAFAWTYAVALVPAGYIADRFGARFTYGIALISWSIATILQGLAGTFIALFALRLIIGVLETPAFPSNTRAVAAWFPAQERGTASSVYICGQYIGTALFTGSLIWLATHYSWHMIFYVTGGIGILFGFIWIHLYRSPMDCKKVNQAEFDYIRQGGALVEAGKQDGPAMKFQWQDIRELFRHRQIWAICVGKFTNTSMLYFFLTWFPTYLMEERQITNLKVGLFAIMPFIGATIGVLLGGTIADLLIRKGFSISFSRKLPMIAGSAMGMSIIFVNFTDSNIICIAILTAAFFAQGMAATTWATVAEIAPQKLIGLTGSITSFAANMGGVVCPLIIGIILKYTHSFSAAFWFIGALALIGTISYSFFLGKIYRIELRS